MGYATAQLVQPYRDRPNEGTLAIFTEFSPMADPSFEAGRPGESAIELGRVIDRGLRCVFLVILFCSILLYYCDFFRSCNCLFTSTLVFPKKL